MPNFRPGTSGSSFHISKRSAYFWVCLAKAVEVIPPTVYVRDGQHQPVSRAADDLGLALMTWCSTGTVGRGSLSAIWWAPRLSSICAITSGDGRWMSAPSQAWNGLDRPDNGGALHLYEVVREGSTQSAARGSAVACQRTHIDVRARRKEKM